MNTTRIFADSAGLVRSRAAACAGLDFSAAQQDARDHLDAPGLSAERLSAGRRLSVKAGDWRLPIDFGSSGLF